MPARPGTCGPERRAAAGSGRRGAAARRRVPIHGRFFVQRRGVLVPGRSPVVVGVGIGPGSLRRAVRSGCRLGCADLVWAARGRCRRFRCRRGAAADSRGRWSRRGGRGRPGRLRRRRCGGADVRRGRAPAAMLSAVRWPELRAAGEPGSGPRRRRPTSLACGAAGVSGLAGAFGFGSELAGLLLPPATARIWQSMPIVLWIACRRFSAWSARPKAPASPVVVNARVRTWSSKWPTWALGSTSAQVLRLILVSVCRISGHARRKTSTSAPGPAAGPEPAGNRGRRRAGRAGSGRAGLGGAASDAGCAGRARLAGRAAAGAGGWTEARGGPGRARAGWPPRVRPRASRWC